MWQGAVGVGRGIVLNSEASKFASDRLGEVGKHCSGLVQGDSPNSQATETFKARAMAAAS